MATRHEILHAIVVDDLRRARRVQRWGRSGIALLLIGIVMVTEILGDLLGVAGTILTPIGGGIVVAASGWMLGRMRATQLSQAIVELTTNRTLASLALDSDDPAIRKAAANLLNPKP